MFCTKGQSARDLKVLALLMAYQSAEYEFMSYTPAKKMTKYQLRLPLDILAGTH